MFLLLSIAFVVLVLTLIRVIMERDLTYVETFVIAFVLVEVILMAAPAHADRSEPKFKIAIIDTGYNPDLIKNGPKLKLCKHGHFDFASGTSTVGYGKVSHGTYVAAIIAKELETVDYCAVIYNVMVRSGDMPTENVVTAFNKASYEGVIAVNASYRSIIRSIAERESVRDAASRGVVAFVAAGNDHRNLDLDCLAFPACFDIPNMVVVGALTPDLSKRMPASNYGSRVKQWFSGDYNHGQELGTSFAAPRALSAYIRSLATPKVAMKTPLRTSETPTTSTQD